MTTPAGELSRRAIAISGALGSGKSSVARRLAEQLGLEFVSTGDLHRSIASRRRLSTLELNKIAERDRRIDDEVDDLLRELAAENRAVVVDSRMAWWFIPNALSVHLTVAPEVGAERIHARRDQTAEEYATRDEARRKVGDRADSERLRFRSMYNVDTLRLRNYQVVVDTTTADIEQVVDDVVTGLRAQSAGDRPAIRPGTMVLSPSQIYPTERLRHPWEPGATDLIGSDEPLHRNPIGVGYSYPHFFVVDGHRRLSAALHAGHLRVPAQLVAEGDEEVADGVTADSYFADALRRPEIIADWSAVNGVRLGIPAGTP